MVFDQKNSDKSRDENISPILFRKTWPRLKFLRMLGPDPHPRYISSGGYCVVATFLLCLRWKWPRLHFLQYLQPSAGRKAQKWWWSLFTGSALNSFQQIFPSVLTYFQCWCPIDQIWFCRGLYWMFWKGFVDLVSIIYSTMAHQIEKLKSLKSTITEAEMCLV